MFATGAAEKALSTRPLDAKTLGKLSLKELMEIIHWMKDVIEGEKMAVDVMKREVEVMERQITEIGQKEEVEAMRRKLEAHRNSIVEKMELIAKLEG